MKPFLETSYSYLPLVWGATLAFWLGPALQEGGHILPVSHCSTALLHALSEFRKPHFTTLTTCPVAVALAQWRLLLGPCCTSKVPLLAPLVCAHTACCSCHRLECKCLRTVVRVSTQQRHSCSMDPTQQHVALIALLTLALACRLLQPP